MHGIRSVDGRRPVVLTQFSGDSSGAGRGFCTSATLLVSRQRNVTATRCDKMRQATHSNTMQHSSSASCLKSLSNLEKSSNGLIHPNSTFSCFDFSYLMCSCDSHHMILLNALDLISNSYGFNHNMRTIRIIRDNM